MANIGIRVVGVGVLAAERGDDPGAAGVGQVDESLMGAFIGDHFARNDDRVARTCDQRHRLGHGFGVGRRCGAWPGAGDHRVAGVLLGDILGQGHHNRAGPAGLGDLKRPGGGLGHLGGGLGLDHRLGDAAVHLRVVDFLERFAADMVARHMADEQHQGR